MGFWFCLRVARRFLEATPFCWVLKRDTTRKIRHFAVPPKKPLVSVAGAVAAAATEVFVITAPQPRS